MSHINRALVLAAVGFLAAQGIATAAEENLGKEGVFTMIVVKDGKKFNRCIMHQGQGTNVLRIASPKENIYSMSVPTAGQDRGASFTVAVDGKAPIFISMTGQDKTRTWSTLPAEAVVAIKNGKKTIDVELGSAKFKWRLNNDMKGSFIVLDSCVSGYLHGA